MQKMQKLQVDARSLCNRKERKEERKKQNLNRLIIVYLLIVNKKSVYLLRFV